MQENGLKPFCGGELVVTDLWKYREFLCTVSEKCGSVHTRKGISQTQITGSPLYVVFKIHVIFR
jgi:hypothetical protein